MRYERGGRDYGRGSDDYGNRGQDRFQSRNEGQRYGQQGGRGYGRDDDDDDRGFFERAGDEVRSWFGDEDANRRREAERGGDYGDRDQQRNWDRGYQGQPYGGRQDRGREDYGRERFGGQSSYGPSRDQNWSSGNLGRSSSGRESAYGQGQYGRSTYSSGDEHGYHDWRRRQIEELDRDYDEYRRENQSQFDTQFGAWRSKRTSQRSSLGQVQEHMEVVGSDGQHIGTVDKVRGDRIILTKNDAEAGGRHHSIPCSWIESVDDKVTVNKTHDEAQRQWRDEERNSAMFGDDQQQQQERSGGYARSWNSGS